MSAGSDLRAMRPKFIIVCARARLLNPAPSAGVGGDVKEQEIEKWVASVNRLAKEMDAVCDAAHPAVHSELTAQSRMRFATLAGKLSRSAPEREADLFDLEAP